MAQPPQYQSAQQPLQQQQQQQPAQMPQSQRTFSPPQVVASPGAQQGFPMPPTKRQRLSPGPQSQPASPYVQTQSTHQSPYSMSPSATGPPSNTASPHFNNAQLPTSSSTTPTATSHQSNNTPSASTPTHTPFAPVQLPPNIYNTPYQNGNSSTPINGSTNPLNSHYQQSGNYPMPNSQQGPPVYQQPQLHQQPHTPGGFPQNHYNHSAQFQGNNVNMTPQLAGSMGPPTKPVEREMANDDQTDVLANAGVDLRAEESYAMSFYTGSFGSQPSFSQSSVPAGGHAYTQFNPGDADSFYGAGPMNQPGEPADKDSQDKATKEQVDKAWAEAASSLARSREHELNNPHVNVAALWRKMDKIARENGVALNTDPGGKMPALKLASEFKSNVDYKTAVGTHASLTATNGPFLPVDTALADQLALMSLATNSRVRTLLEEAHAISRGRRTGADGIVPAEWANAAAPSQASSATIVLDGAPPSGWESAISPMTNPLKRSNSTTNRLPTPVSDGAKTPGETVRYTNELVKALRTIATAERDLEEERLRKRHERANGGTPRPSSVAPGTPLNAAAPEPKPLTKKEREKQEKGKQNAVDNHAQANSTMNIMLGGSKKKNKYSWMAGGTGSGANTPGRLATQGLPGTPGGNVGGGAADKVRRTAEGGRPIGGLREHDQRMVEMKDWILALENDGKELRALQTAYASPHYDKK